MSSLINSSAIPGELRAIPQWVVWNLFPPIEPGAKPRKVPIDPKTGGNASVTDPSTWGSFDQAVARCESDRLAGIGFVFTKESGFVGFDFDKCLNPATGEVEPGAEELIVRLWSYTESSPGGDGFHVIAKGQLPQGGRRKGRTEMYDSGRFFTMTGNVVGGTPLTIEDRAAEISAIHAEVFGVPKEVRLPTPASSADLEQMTDHEVLRRARTAKNHEKFERLWSGDHTGYASPSEADLALCSILAFWTGPNPSQIDRLFRQSGLMRDKWDEPRGDRTIGEMTIAKALEGKTEFYDTHFKLTDSGNAERLVRRFGEDIQYCHPWKKWIVWDGKRWRIDDSGRVMALSKDVARGIYAEVAQIEDARVRESYAGWAHTCERVERRKALVELAKSEPGIPITPDEFDREPWLFNCANGTLDLRTGELRPHRREDLITKLAPVEYDEHATCPTWDRFLTRVIPTPEIRSFIQRAVGWSITGEVLAQALFFLYGLGANGKTTFLRVLQALLGPDYAIQAAPELLLAKGQRAHPTEIADLHGIRLAVCTEIGVERAFDEVLVKQLTGNDRVRARRMKEDFWEFEPVHHIWIAANHKPSVRGTDEAIWRRILLIPFVETIPAGERDPHLLEKLQAELPGILAWAVRGCLEYQATGLQPPPHVLEATQEYREEMDVVGEFLNERCEKKDGERVQASKLYNAYSFWAIDNGVKALPQNEFALRIGERGIKKKKSGSVFYLDLKLKEMERREGLGGFGHPSAINSFMRPPKAVDGEKGSRPSQGLPTGPVTSTPAGKNGDPPAGGTRG